MNDLGRLEDLPQSYLDALRRLNLVPLWPSLRGVMPANTPRPQTKAIHWPYATLKEQLLRAGELTPIEKAERRVLVLANPGHGLEKMQASAAIYLGMQLLMPGEWAPSHRHTPNAVRMVVEGEGAWTTVDGEKCPMQRGDLILTPTGLWHEHGHDGQEPVIWLDVLDLPLVYYLEASYHVNGAREKSQSEALGSTLSAHPQAGIAPTKVFGRSSKAYPMLRYPWAAARDALLTLGASDDCNAPAQITYINPETGADAQNILGFYAMMLKPLQSVELPARSPASVFHLIEGQAVVETAGERFALDWADTCCVPGYASVRLHNPSSSMPAFLFLADESPLHRKLGLYEERA